MISPRVCVAAKKCAHCRSLPVDRRSDINFRHCFFFFRPRYEYFSSCPGDNGSSVIYSFVRSEKHGQTARVSLSLRRVRKSGGGARQKRGFITRALMLPFRVSETQRRVFNQKPTLCGFCRGTSTDLMRVCNNVRRQ